jgi:hypothetical protein
VEEILLNKYTICSFKFFMLVSSFLMMEEDPDGCPRKGCRVEFFLTCQTLFACMGLVAKPERRNGEGEVQWDM